MLTAARTTGVTFVPRVGVAPSTTTMQLPARTLEPPRLHTPSMPVKGAGRAARRARAANGKYYIPYETIEDLKGRFGAAGANMIATSGLGIINETDAWMTGRPYGLPGTATVMLTKRANGVNYASTLVGADLGRAVKKTRGQLIEDLCCKSPAQPCCWDDRSARGAFGEAMTAEQMSTAIERLASDQQKHQKLLIAMSIGSAVSTLAWVAVTIAKRKSKSFGGRRRRRSRR